MKSLRIKIFVQVMAAFLFFSCGDGNYENVIVSGVLKDANDLPIANAKVIVNCWAYSTKTWDSQSTQKVVFSDSIGRFKTLFDKGEAIDMQIIADGFIQYEKSITLDRNNVSVDFTLLK